MEIKIIRKKYPRNLKHAENTVYFALDRKDYQVDIYYFDSHLFGKRNVFVDNYKLAKVYEEIEEKYGRKGIEEFQKEFFKELYKYSKGKGLDKVEG